MVVFSNTFLALVVLVVLAALQVVLFQVFRKREILWMLLVTAFKAKGVFGKSVFQFTLLLATVSFLYWLVWSRRPRQRYRLSSFPSDYKQRFRFFCISAIFVEFVSGCVGSESMFEGWVCEYTEAYVGVAQQGAIFCFLAPFVSNTQRLWSILLCLLQVMFWALSFGWAAPGQLAMLSIVMGAGCGKLIYAVASSGTSLHVRAFPERPGATPSRGVHPTTPPPSESATNTPGLDNYMTPSGTFPSHETPLVELDGALRPISDATRTFYPAPSPSGPTNLGTPLSSGLEANLDTPPAGLNLGMSSAPTGLASNLGTPSPPSPPPLGPDLLLSLDLQPTTCLSQEHPELPPTSTAEKKSACVTVPTATEHFQFVIRDTTQTKLDFTSNGLTVIPAEIGQFVSLIELNLWENDLIALPPEIAKLTALRKLNIPANKLTSLPPQIGCLISLREARLGVNQITFLPAEIGDLCALEHLLLHGNQLTRLPPDIGRLSSLQKLDLRNNQLTVLPKEICQLSALTWFGLSHNKLHALPQEFCQLTALKTLLLTGNPLQSPPETVIEACWRGWNETYDWSGLERYFASHTFHTNRNVKIILLGAPMAGKTSLRQSVLRGAPDCTTVDDRTLCVDVQQAFDKAYAWQGEWLTTWWDFGGDLEYWSLQQPFLSHEALYILVLHGGKLAEDYQNSVGRWLEMLEVKVPGALVLPVLTHLDEFEGLLASKQEIAREFLQRHQLKRKELFDQRAKRHGSTEIYRPLHILLDRIVAISSMKGVNLQLLQATILTSLGHVPIAGQKVPSYYTTGQEVVEKLRQAECKGVLAVSWRHLVDRVAKDSLLQTTQAGDVLRYLNVIGIVRLVGSTVLLRPEDLFKAIKCLIRPVDPDDHTQRSTLRTYAADLPSHHSLLVGLRLLQRDGILELPVADFLLRDACSDQGLRREMLKLLTNTGVLLETTGAARFLFPCRLPRDPPKLAKQLLFNYEALLEFGDSFPDLYTQLLARLLNINVDGHQPQLLGNSSDLWQTGSFLDWGKELYTEMSWNNGRFLVHVRWNDPALAQSAWRLLRELLREIQRLVYADPGREIPELSVRCPACPIFSNNFSASGDSECSGCHHNFSVPLETSTAVCRRKLREILKSDTEAICFEFHSQKSQNARCASIFPMADDAQPIVQQLLQLDWKEASDSFCLFLQDLIGGKEEKIDPQPALDPSAEGLVRVAIEIQPIFESLLADLMERCRMSPKKHLRIGPVKTLERLRVKLAEQQVQSAMCFDLNRATLLCSNYEEFFKAVANMAVVFGRVRKLKNKFNPQLAEPPCLFYQVEVPFQSPLLTGNWVVEIQITTPEFYETKELTHTIYEVRRQKKSGQLPTQLSTWTDGMSKISRPELESKASS